MMQNWFLVQVSTDMFYHMADDISLNSATL